MKIENKVARITGAASGIGRAVRRIGQATGSCGRSGGPQ